jgi:hypothetical protein
LLGLLRDQAKALGGLSRKAFDLVYEGFWDLYCKKPANPAEMPVKKLEGFIQRVKLITPAQPAQVQEGDEEGSSPSASKDASALPLKSIVRIRIPLIRPRPVQSQEDGNEDDEDEEEGNNEGTQRSKVDTSRTQ